MSRATYEWLASSILGMLVGALFATTRLEAAEDYRYQYVLNEGAGVGVCSHMQQVYNKAFAYPWKHPYLAEDSYGPESTYAFPKRAGLAHSSEMTYAMRYSRLPTSQEFDAIEWREGRMDYGSPAGIGPALIAEADIDNDGQVELLIKSGFMRSYQSDGGRGGEDYLYVLHGSARDLPEPIPSKARRAHGPDGGPAVIAPTAEAPYRLVRPFRYEGQTYVAGYLVAGKYDRAKELIHIVKYLGGGYLVKVGERTPVQLERVCVLGMKTK